MSKFAIIIIALCIIGGVFFGWYQNLVQKKAEVDELSWQYKVFLRESGDREFYEILAARAIPKGAIIQSRDLAIDNVGKDRYGDFKRKREIIGIKAAKAIPQNAFITLDQLEKIPVGYEDVMTGSSKQHLSVYTNSIMQKRPGAPATSK